MRASNVSYALRLWQAKMFFGFALVSVSCQTQAPCFEDSNCPTGEVCDQITQTCLTARVDAGVPNEVDGGKPDAGATLDAGHRDSGVVNDAGASPDAGALMDAGVSVDAGVLIDAGVLMDAGAGTDAGIMADAGVSTDAGSMLDAGHVLDDGGSTDAGVGHLDAGSNMMDGGFVPDSGLGSDAGAVVGDGGPIMDAGVLGECGNAIVEGNEQCDDGNTNPDDGCASCQVQTAYSCWGSQSYCDEDNEIAWVGADGGYETIADAIDSGKRTIFVRAGDHSGVDITTSGITIVGELGANVSPGSQVNETIRVAAENVTISGLSLTNPSGDDCMEIENSTTNLTLTNIFIDTCGKHGIESKGSSSFTLNRCRIENCQEHGLHVDGSFTVSNCIIASNGLNGSDKGVKLKNNTASSSALLFNTVVNNGNGSAEGAMQCDSEAIFRGNLFFNNAPDGTSEFTNCSSYVSYSRVSTTNLEGPEYNNTDCAISFEVTGSYRLTSDSSCRDVFLEDDGIQTGDPMPIANWPEYDFDGAPRLRGAGYEPGAFELSAE